MLSFNNFEETEKIDNLFLTIALNTYWQGRINKVIDELRENICTFVKDDSKRELSFQTVLKKLYPIIKDSLTPIDNNIILFQIMALNINHEIHFLHTIGGEPSLTPDFFAMIDGLTLDDQQKILTLLTYIKAEPEVTQVPPRLAYLDYRIKAQPQIFQRILDKFYEFPPGLPTLIMDYVDRAVSTSKSNITEEDKSLSFNTRYMDSYLEQTLRITRSDYFYALKGIAIQSLKNEVQLSDTLNREISLITHWVDTTHTDAHGTLGVAAILRCINNAKDTAFIAMILNPAIQDHYIFPCWSYVIHQSPQVLVNYLLRPEIVALKQSTELHIPLVESKLPPSSPVFHQQLLELYRLLDTLNHFELEDFLKLFCQNFSAEIKTESMKSLFKKSGHITIAKQFNGKVSLLIAEIKLRLEHNQPNPEIIKEQLIDCTFQFLKYLKAKNSSVMLNAVFKAFRETQNAINHSHVLAITAGAEEKTSIRYVA